MPVEPIDPDFQAWDAWDPATLAGLLRGVQARWYVVGGWAIELFTGEAREHEDLEIAVPAGHFEAVRKKLADYEFFVAGREGVWPLDGAGDAFFHNHQTWVSDPLSGTWKLDVMRDPHDGDTWICRRDRTIRRPYSEVVATTDEGIPYLKPEFALLFKAKQMRPKDDQDLAASLPLLAQQSRTWLAAALAQVYGSEHPWIPTLG